MMLRTLFVLGLVLVAATAEDFTTNDADTLVPDAANGIDTEVFPLPPKIAKASGNTSPLELELTEDDAAIKSKAGLWRRRRRGRGFFKDVGHQAKRVTAIWTILVVLGHFRSSASRPPLPASVTFPGH